MVWRVVAIVAALGVLAFASLVYLRGDHYLRRQTRLILESQLGALLAGEVHIDRITDLSLGYVLAEGVTVLDPQKRPVLHAEALRLDIDLSALPSGIRFS